MRFRIALAAGLFAYFAFLLHYNNFFAAGPDAVGYCTEARLIAGGRLRMFVTPMRDLGIDQSFIDLFGNTGMIPSRRRPMTLVPSYPAGVPLHQALLATVGGWTYAAYLVSPLAAIGSFLLLFGIARELKIERLYAAGAGAIWLAVPVLIGHAVQPVSDVPAAFYALLTMWLALRGRPAAAGAAMGIGVWIRPTNLLIVVPLLIALRRRQWKLAAAGALPFGIALAIWNKQLYGSPFRTGYGSFFDVIAVRPLCGWFHLVTLAQMLTPVVAIGGLLMLFDRAVDRRQLAMLAAWIGVFYLFYAFYGYCDFYVSSRFLLPAMPALLIAFAIGLQRFVTNRAAAVALIVALLVTQMMTIHSVGTLFIKRDQSVVPESVRWAEAQLPKNAIVAAGLLSGAFLFDANRFTVQWGGMADRDRVAPVRAAAKKAHLQWYAVLSEDETSPETFNAWLPATWTPVATHRNVTLWRLVE